MALTQLEADSLLRMTKEFVDAEPLEFSQTQPMNYDRLLQSADRREQFVLTVERGQRNRIRLKFQTRARVVITGPARNQRARSPESARLTLQT